MSWFGNSLLPVIQETFWDHPWESDPKKAAEIIKQQPFCESEARYIEKMTPKEWLEACRMARVFEDKNDHADW